MSRDKPQHKGRGYDIRIQRQGSDWLSERTHGWGMDGQLPEEWDQVKADPTVERAVIYPAAQRKWRAGRRRHIDEYPRS